ncbi:MAG TPA: zf-HC2 domain-containing protein [Pyrinomonadaceae bacterium]|jgi:hypothetical protein
MELDFDKEIDAILRRARESETALAAANQAVHMDADEIAAFAENALPEASKMRFTAHLADCARCRKILSGVILPGSETKSEIALADEKATVVTAVPWYRRLFQFPNLAYSLGALALVCGGLLAFMALQSLNSFQNADVSRVSNKTLDTRSEPMQMNANSTANTAMSAPSNTNSASVYTPSATPQSGGAMASNSAATKAPNDAPFPAISQPQRRDEDTKVAKNNPFQVDGAEDKPQATKEENKRAEVAGSTKDDQNVQTEKQSVADSTVALAAPKKARESADKTKTVNSADGETTSAGGKTFRRSANVWYDTAYQNQATTNVTRGTSEYKKLDKDLRVIVENLGGTVVIVWKGRAYRIR